MFDFLVWRIIVINCNVYISFIIGIFTVVESAYLANHYFLAASVNSCFCGFSWLCFAESFAQYYSLKFACWFDKQSCFWCTYVLLYLQLNHKRLTKLLMSVKTRILKQENLSKWILFAKTKKVTIWIGGIERPSFNSSQWGTSNGSWKWV